MLRIDCHLTVSIVCLLRPEQRTNVKVSCAIVMCLETRDFRQRTHSLHFFLFAHLQEKEFSTLQTETSLKAILSTESLKEKESTLSKGDTTKASGPEGGIMVKAVYRSQTDHRIVAALKME